MGVALTFFVKKAKRKGNKNCKCIMNTSIFKNKVCICISVLCEMCVHECIYMCAYAYMYICETYVYSALAALDPLEVELQKAVNRLVDDRN